MWRQLPRHARTDPCVPCATAGGRLTDQQHEAQQHQDAGERAARRPVERGLELLEDGGGQGGEPQHRERAVLREQVYCDEQAAAQNCEPQLRKYHAPKGIRRAGAQRPRRLLDRGVESAQRRRGGHVDEREVRQRGDQDAGPETVQRGHHADPRVAVDERGNGERRDQQRPPERAARNVGALHQPGRADAEHDAQRHGDRRPARSCSAAVRRRGGGR